MLPLHRTDTQYSLRFFLLVERNGGSTKESSEADPFNLQRQRHNHQDKRHAVGKWQWMGRDVGTMGLIACKVY
jgi:hypothetical protein